MNTTKFYSSVSRFILLSSILFLCIVSSNAQSFTKVTTGPVVNTPGDSRSVNWADVNGDGWIDLFITNGPSGGQNNFLYINDGAGGFAAVTDDPIVLDGQPSDGATFADADNDGDLDCYVANWYDNDNLFYINNGDGTFIESPGIVTSSGGYCETATWGDYDSDSFVDLYVTNSAGVNKNFLYHNEGNNTFTKIIEGPPVSDVTDSRGATWTDIDWDGDVDLFVVNESNEGQYIYRNDPLEFVSVTGNSLIENPGTTMSGSWGDYDNDLDLDVFLAREGMSNALFRSEGLNTFTHMSSDTVSNTDDHSFSSAWGDIDNDADLDLFVTNAFYTDDLQVNFMYTNNGDGTFSRLDNIAPVLDSTWSYGCAFGDYDNDGFLDLAVATVRFEGDDYPDLLYHNDGNSNNWVTVTVQGTYVNYSAIGIKVWVASMIDGNQVWQLREISSQSAYCSQNDMRAHFGLADSESIDLLAVEWSPGDLEFFENLDPNQFITIIEGQGIPGNIQITPGYVLSIYPNPAQTTINISLNQSIEMTSIPYEILDLKGSAVQLGTTRNDSINIQTLEPGNYVLKLQLPGQTVNQQFIKIQ